MPRRLVIFSIDSRNEGNESKREKKKVFFGRGGGDSLFPLSPFGAITGLFSEPDENLVGLRGRKFLRSVGKKKKKKKKGRARSYFTGNGSMLCGFGGRTNREMAKSRSLLSRYLQVGRQSDVYNCFLRAISRVLRVERTVARHAFLVHKH